MINFLTKSLSIEIENFVSFIKNRIGLGDIEYFTKSAFVQCRKKIKPEVFKYLSDNLVEEFYTDNDELYQMHVKMIDYKIELFFSYSRLKILS